ncbi:hypothetical protein C1893_06780 [Pseudomonas sp. MPR-ANC1]|uniref:DUF2280 domain-containing protein n=1 Tax=Pseudomonas sp. MPR-ANC1 TaxID=2075548 RepID=UPI000CD0C589|nr:DUF2280 domain-containing protein [Pseudomonas sp. MPR-ANC1]POA49325.1 hypothetical protein C1893_06780 [Pseudomonas sp. MPR-ANC1]
MAALNNEIKSFIVQALACFDSPSQVAVAVRERFGVVVSRQQVETHDPTRKSSKGLAKRWVTLFNDTRDGFRNEMVKEPIANRAVRLRALGRMLEEAEASGNLVLAMKLLEQAARECGDMNTNRRAKAEGEPMVPAAPVGVDFSFAGSAALKP